MWSIPEAAESHDRSTFPENEGSGPPGRSTSLYPLGKRNLRGWFFPSRGHGVAPEGVPLIGVAAIQGAQVGHRVGTLLAPTHPAQAQPLVDYRLARRLHRPAGDLPAVAQVPRIVHPLRMVAQVAQHLLMPFTDLLCHLLAVQPLQDTDQHRPAGVLERLTT